MDSIVPTNTPRDVQDYFRKKQQLLEGYQEEEPSVSVSKSVSTPAVIEPEPVPKISKPTRGYKLTLTHSLYKVSFEVQDISVADYQLAIKVPKTDFRFEPQPNSRFSLECMGETYNVVYLGGLFDFPSDSSWSITFMLETEENDNTWTSDA